MIFDVVNSYDIIFVRNAAKELASSIGFSKEDITRIDLAVSELAHNIISHAVQGKLVLDKITDSETNGRLAFEAVSIDKGPGIKDVEKALEIGYSTKGSLGTGLASTKEVMDFFTISSQVGIGTKVTVRKWLK